jgi:acyl-CoA synthetase (AMP-forming)/AMP-acid ligase II
MLPRKNILYYLNKNTTEKKDEIAFTFLNGKENINHTWEQINNRSLHLASFLSKKFLKGERIILLFQNNNMFIESILACFYADLIAVPVEPPNNHNTINKLKNIMADCLPVAIMTQLRFKKNKFFKSINNIDIVYLESIQDEKFRIIDLNPSNKVAFLQYTSGSTAEPKGVIISHENLLHNLEIIWDGTGRIINPTGVFWLPFFHDMGLVGTVFFIIFCSGRGIFFTPIKFITDPLFYLKTISDYKASVTVAPNFAFDLICNRYYKEKHHNFDLSNLIYVANGSEMVSSKTLLDFYNTFKVYNFKFESWHPCYGMAECTLYISGESQMNYEKIVYGHPYGNFNDKINIIPKESKNSIGYVSVGFPTFDYSLILFSDNKKNIELGEKVIAEICFNSNSIGNGYFNKNDISKPKKFEYVSYKGKKYFRTGDMGFIYEGNLYITGRKKDIIIINGKNIFCGDIEKILSKTINDESYKNFIVTTIIKKQKELIVCIIECKKVHIENRKNKNLYNKIISVIFEYFQMNVFDICLVSSNSLPRTSSGKIQRFLCKNYYENGDLSLLNSLRNKDLDIK